MHKRYFSLLLMLCLPLLGFAQIALPLDFEQPAANYTFEGFEGADSAIEMNPDQSGENTSATVMRTIKTDGSAFFAGTTVELETPIDFTTNKGISIQTWSPKANIPVRLKLENADASAFVELDVNTTVANQWETLTFDLESRLDANVDYVKVIVFFEFINGLAGDGSTYYYDNVQTADVSGGPSVGLPVDFEDASLTYDLVGFEGANASVIANPDASGTNTSGTVAAIEKTDGAAFFAGATLTLDEAIDFSSDNAISISSWSPKADIPVRVKIENADASVFVEVDVNTTVANAWETMTFDFSSAPAAQYTKVIFFYEFIDGVPGDGSTYFFDDITTTMVGGGGPQVALPVDFESMELNYRLTGFEGADSAIEANPDQTGENTSATVVRTTKTDGAQFFAGTTLELDVPIDFSTNQGISIQTWSPKADIPVRVKIENADASVLAEVDVNTTVANAWETLTFDFSNAPAGEYTKVIVFFEFIADLAGDGSTYYYDNIAVAPVDGGGPQVALPVDFESMELNYRLTGFEGADSAIETNPDQTGENTSATVVRTTKTDGAQFFAGTTLELDVPIDFSTDKGISISTWSPKADIPVRVKIENADASVFAEVDVNTTVANAWETLTFDFSNAPAGTYTKVIVFFEFIADLAGDGSTYYYDNIAVAPVDGGGPQVALPVDFESMELNYRLTGFEGADSAIETNPDQTGENTSATVVRTTKTDGAQFFAGTTLELDVPIDFSTDQGISIQTWSPKAEIPVRVKIENADASVFAEVDVNTTVANAWETLTFDFSNAPAGTYTKVIVFFEFIADLAGDGSTYYYDNIAVAAVDGGGGPGVILPVTFEDETLNYNPIGFEGADSAVEANPDQTGVNPTATVVRTTKTDGAQFFAGTTIELDQPIDLSNTGMLFVDTWSPKANIPVRVKIENADASVFAELDVNTTTASAWETLMYDFSTAPAADYVKVIVFFEFVPDLAGDGTTYYFDNINVDRAVSVTNLTAEQVQVFPNPTSTLWEVNSPEVRIEVLDLFNMNGQRILTATPDANQFRIDASALPTGTYVLRVLTAEGRRITRLVKQ